MPGAQKRRAARRPPLLVEQTVSALLHSTAALSMTLRLLWYLASLRFSGAAFSSLGAASSVIGPLPPLKRCHVTVNGRRVTIPSYRLRVGDLVEVREKGKQMPLLLEAIKSAERDVPDYVEADHSKMTAKLTRVPALSDVPYPVTMEPNLVVEFYSR